MTFGSDFCRWAALLPFGLLALSSTTFAQIEAGDFRIGASVGAFTYTDIDVEDLSVETKEFSLGPTGDLRIGYAITEIFEAGLNVNVSHVDVEVEGIGDDDATSWAIGPYGEVNFPMASDGTAVLAPGFGVVYRALESSVVDLDGVDLIAEATFKYFVAANASIDLGLRFSYFIGDADAGGADLDADGFSIGPRIGISIWP